MRDQTNKKDHEESAQLAAESAGAIRTISSLTREDECLRMYSKALEGPEKKALKAAIISNIILGFVVGVGFFTIALIFYYGARQLIDGLAPSNFFIALSATIFGTTQAGSVVSSDCWLAMLSLIAVSVPIQSRLFKSFGCRRRACLPLRK